MSTFSTESILRDHDLISAPGTLAFYKACEVTEIVAFDAGAPINVFTIVVLHEEEILARPEGWLNVDPLKLGKVKFGIYRYYVTLEAVRDQLEKICIHKIWDMNKGKPLILGSALEPLPKQYIAPDGTHPLELNKVLKNNFRNGSYIIEIFDTNKEHIKVLTDNSTSLQEISEKIQQYVPIEIGALSDRLGNIIFQYPNKILDAKMSFSRSNDGIKLDCHWDQRLSSIPECMLFALTEQDEKEGVLGFGLEKLKPGLSTIKCGNTSTFVRYFAVDEKNKIILASWHGNYIGMIAGNIRIISHEPRTFHTIESGAQEIQFSSAGPGFSVGGDGGTNYLRSIQARLYEVERKKLREELAFVQYFRTDRQKALNDIRTIINKYGEHGLCLWDPYLVAEDIKETLFHCIFGDANLKVIGSYSSDKNSTLFNAIDFTDFVNTNRLALKPEANANHLSINLEFRIQHSNRGWSFHDRFIIFPNVNDRVRAWSLGTSLNSLGKSHHIMQEVSNPRHVLDAFMWLWDELNHPDCVVWKG